MNEFTLKSNLEEMGFKFSQNTLKSDFNTISWYAWKKFPNDSQYDCKTNEKPPTIVVYPYECIYDNVLSNSIEVEITGELSNNIWTNFKLYSITFEEFFEKYDSIINILYKSWNTAFENSLESFLTPTKDS